MTDCSLTIDGRIATVTLDRAAKRNRLSKALLESVLEACATLTDRNDVWIVVLRGHGPDFSTGADLTDPGMATMVQAPLGQRRRLLQLGPRVVHAIQELPQTTI